MTTVPWLPEQPVDPSPQAESVVVQPNPAMTQYAPVDVQEPPAEAITIHTGTEESQ